MNQIVTTNADHHTPWNKGKLIGQKSPLKLKEIWAIRIRLQLANRTRELALFNLSIDSKLRGCDLVKLRVCDVAQSNRVSTRAMIMQQKTHRPVQFEITEQTRESVGAWISQAQLKSDQYLFPCFQAEFIVHRIFRLGNMLGLWMTGLNRLVSTLRFTEPIPCAEQKQRLCTARRKTYEPCNCCWGIPNLKVRSDTWVLKLMTLWKYQNKPRSSRKLNMRSLLNGRISTADV